MRTFIFIIISFLWSASFTSLRAQQTCDILTNGITSTPSIMSGNGTTTITFDVVNEAGEGTCSYPVNSVLVVVSLPASGLNFQAFTSPINGPYFAWTYVPSENIITGINHTAIADGQGEVVTATLAVTSVPVNAYPACRAVQLAILNNPDGPNFPSNNEGNDNGETTITITPANLSSTVNCVANAVQPTPTFTAPTCSAPVITVTDTPASLDCEGTRVYSFAYSACGGCPFSSFTWTYTYTIERTIHPAESGGPVANASTVNCESQAIAPTTFPTVIASCGENLTGTQTGPVKKSQIEIDFSDPVVIGPTQAPNTWYTDRYAPSGFTNAVFGGDSRLKHSISAADCEGCRPPALNGSFYNTQGRKYDLGAGTNYMEIDLYIPADWATSNRRMAGLWGTAVNVSNAVSAYPILEFTSDGNNPRFRGFVNGPWVDLGLPMGFVYNAWVKLQIRLLPTGEFLYQVITDQGTLTYQTVVYSSFSSVRIANVILQGHNTASPGVTYDIYWDNFVWRENFNASLASCQGDVTYTYDYTDCAGLVFPWTYTYTVDRTLHPSEDGGPVPSASTVTCATFATEPLPASLPTVLASCGEGPLTPGTAIKKSQIEIDFSDPVVIGPSQAPNTWYTDRYAPAGFTNAVFGGGDRLKHTINAADCESCRPGGFTSAFYNTQGRKYDLGTGTNYAQIDLYVASDWATTNRRMAGFWAAAFDGSNAISAYPILEYTSDGGNPRFRIWPASPAGGWQDIGLPTGFVHGSWVTLQMRILPSGEFLFTVGDLNYQTSNLASLGSATLGNIILQGHNTTAPGVTYDIYWDNLEWRETYVAPACEGIITYTFDYVDPCKNLVFPWTYTYTVDDDVVPTFTRPADVTIFTTASCTYDASVAETGDVTNELDNCSTGLEATFSDITVDGPCQGTKVITRTWSLVDNCGNAAANQVQTITVSDNTIPTFTRPADITIAKDATCMVNDTPTGMAGDVTNEADNCSTGLNATFADVVVNGCTGSYTITRTWSLVDNCGNAAANQVQTITVVDNTAPIVTAPTTVDLECSTTLPVAATDITEFLALTGTAASDNCTAQGNLSVSSTTGTLVGTECNGTITRIYTITDACGNATMVNHVFTVTDNTVPSFTRPADITIAKDATCAVNDTPTGMAGDVTNEADNCSTGLNATFADVVVNGCTGSYTITRTWSLVDNCGNAAANQVQTITVVDNTAPIVTAPTTVDLECSTTLPVAATDITEFLALTGTAASDNCTAQGNLSVSSTTGTLVGTECNGTITRIYTITDACGNATMVNHVFTVTDNTVPSFTRPADITIAKDATCAVNDTPTGMAGDVTNEADNCSTGLNATFADVVVNGCTGSYTITRTWSLVDNCGNAAANQVQTITVVDNTAPIVTAPTTVDLECSTTLPVAATDITEFLALTGTTASDNCTAQGNLTVSSTTGTLVGTECNGTITRIYTITDACGNATMVNHVFTVTDNTIPVITRLGDATVYICQNETYTDAGATATDNCSGTLTSEIVVGGTYPGNTNTAGTYTITYDVEDDCGNDAVQVTRTVIVRPHPTATISGTATVLQNAPVAPVITFTGSGGTGPYTFDYTIQFNSDPPTNHTAGPGNPVTVAQSNAVVGVFTYTLTRVTDSYGCQYVLPAPQPTAVITVISACDLSPSIPRPINGSFVNAQVKDGVVQFSNAGPGPTSGTLTFRISNIANFGITIPNTSGTYGGLSCQNSSFTITPGTFFTTVTTTASIPAGGNLRLGYIMTAVGAGGSNGNLTTTVINGTGGDNNNANNKAVRTFVIN